MAKLGRGLLVFLSCCITLVYLPCLLLYWVSPANWWPMGILSIGFPYVWLSFVLFFLIWLCYRPKKSVLFFLLLMAGLPIMLNVFALRKEKPFDTAKQPGTIRVMHWNCMGFSGIDSHFPELQQYRKETVAFLQQYQPDVICLAEFSDAKHEWLLSNISLLRDSLGYQYYIFRPHYATTNQWFTVYQGNAIFSRIPFADTGFVPYSGKRVPEGIVWADLVQNGKRTRVISTHLQSMNLSRTDNSMPVDENQYEDSAIIYSPDKIAKLRYFQPYHVSQANEIRAFFDSSKYPVVFTADLNSTPSSYVYKKIRGDMRDAFLEKGSGFGRSYESKQPALRIDYILHSKPMTVSQYGLFYLRLSDHKAQLADIEN